MIETTRKQREFARREEDILSAALSLFERADWQSVTVAQIANKAEIGKGTVYKHFACKEEIYARIALSHFEQFREQWPIKIPEENRLAAVEQILRLAFQISLDDPVGAKVAHYCHRADVRKRLPETVAKAFEDMEKHDQCFFEDLLEAGMKSGEIPRQSVEELVIALHASFHGTLRMIWDGEIAAFEGLTPERFIEINSQFMVAGILGKRSH
ncbi:TetR/AcrR family transcriptional regulator [Parashewanella tropica]|uniref:TetR/AcrR family transcriptional regulator n=1 Tax=Parashewanella tropica TaxID=2547970 RepID=UPI00105A0106|nr:TetR/AcrR family transcriptional regulator [Parashewanella tropica]